MIGVTASTKPSGVTPQLPLGGKVDTLASVTYAFPMADLTLAAPTGAVITVRFHPTPALLSYLARKGFVVLSSRPV